MSTAQAQHWSKGTVSVCVCVCVQPIVVDNCACKFTYTCTWATWVGMESSHRTREAVNLPTSSSQGYIDTCVALPFAGLTYTCRCA